YISAFRDLDPIRTNGEYRRLLHLRSVGNDTDTRTDKKHSDCKLHKSQCGTSLAARNTQSILVAQENRKCRLFRQRNKLQSVEILKRSAFLRTYPRDKPIATGLPVIRSESPSLEAKFAAC